MTQEAEYSGSMPIWKRAFDLFVLLLAFPFWLPLIVSTMWLIKLVSPGPVFYRQRRVGYRGQEFMIWKFRSMKVNAETCSHEGYVAHLIERDQPMTKLDLAGDSRLICGGRLLRAVGLDELPQIFNILRGEMSLVGPRPCTPKEFDRYQPAQRERVQAPPGVTGLWQVSGKNCLTFSEMIELDLHYCKTMSLWKDLQILARTIPAIYSQVIQSQAARRARRLQGSSPVAL